MALIPASKVIGAAVLDGECETMGSIVELMIDEGGGGIGYAVVSYGGTLGVGEKLFAVPWGFLRHTEKGFAIEVDREALETAPGFDKDAWPTAPDPLFS